MSPQNWLCRSERNPALDTHGDNASSNTRHETHGDVQSSIPTTATCLSSKMQKTQSLTRPTTHAAISTSHNTISSQYSQPFMSLAAPKANPIFHAAKYKNLFLKTPFDLRHLTSSSSSSFLLFLTNLARGLTTLSEETTQRKHTYVTTIFLANNKISLATNKPTSPAKTIHKNPRTYLNTSDDVFYDCKGFRKIISSIWIRNKEDHTDPVQNKILP